MQIGPYRFDRVEFAGSLGDLGTLIPLATALMVVTGLGTTPVLCMVGMFYIISGIYFKLPIPVQPLKLVAAIAIAYPEKISLPVIGASGLLFGIILLILALTGLIDRISRFFTKPIMRGIQLGLGLILINKGIHFILKPELFVEQSAGAPLIANVPVNLIVGIAGFLITILFLTSKRFPAALVIVTGGIATGVMFGALTGTDFSMGPTPVKIYIPGSKDLLNALVLLVIPQIPLTLGNAVMGTTDTCKSLFGDGERTKKATYKAFAASMGLVNLFAGFIGAMPMCHGAGGLAAHYRFGARTGGSNIMIGVVFLLIGLVFGKAGIHLLTAIPNSILGVLLLFAGIELALLIKDITKKNELFIALLIAGIGFSTQNMGVAFFAGILVGCLIKWRGIEL